METDRELLTRGIKELGIDPPDTAVDRFHSYLQELKKWNRAYNLTALTSSGDIVIKHFLDSLLYLKAIPEGQWNICDVGSGAGFPGLPLAIIRTDVSITLVEPSRKKTAFLRHMKRQLSLAHISVAEARVEDLKDKVFDIAVTRALFSIGDFVKKAGHVVRGGGFFVLSKGPKLEEEREALPASVKCEIIPVFLPLAGLQRNIVKVTTNAGP